MKKATEMYGYISTYIYSLNNEQFQINSSSYQALSMSIHYLEWINAGGVDSGRCVQSGSDHSADGNDYQSAAETGGTADQVAGGNLEVALLLMRLQRG